MRPSSTGCLVRPSSILSTLFSSPLRTSKTYSRQDTVAIIAAIMPNRSAHVNIAAICRPPILRETHTTTTTPADRPICHSWSSPPCWKLVEGSWELLEEALGRMAGRFVPSISDHVAFHSAIGSMDSPYYILNPKP